MKWSENQIRILTTLAQAGTPNKEIAGRLNISINDVYAKRSQLGITIDKVKGKGMTVNPEFEKAVQEMEKTLPKKAPRNNYTGLEVFSNAGETCIVLARTGDTALIVRPENRCSPYIVPLQHKYGAKDWWQGHYFDNLADAWKYYTEAIKHE